VNLESTKLLFFVFLLIILSGGITFWF